MLRYSMKKVFLSALLLTVITSYHTIAQEVTRGREIKHAVVNFSELAEEERLHPSTNVPRFPMEEGEDAEDFGRPFYTEKDPSKIFLLDRRIPGAAARPHISAFLSTTPSPADTFQAIATDGTSIPPDTHGAVDSNYCVTTINTAVRIQRKNGSSVSSVSLNRFWNSLLTHGTSSGGAFDPRVHYDPIIHRWVMVCDAYGQTTYSILMVAISATSNPTGTWHMYSVATDGTGTTWLDYPNVGLNKKWLAITGNYFSNSSGAFTSAVVFVFDKMAIANGTGAPFVKIMRSGSFTLAPAITYDTTESSLFMLESSNGAAGQLKLWKITGAVSTPAVSSVGSPTTTYRWASSGPSGGIDFAPQLGSTRKVQTNDDRIFSCIQRNNKLWATHAAFFPRTSPTRSAVLWWQMDTTGTPRQVGVIDDASASKFYGFPSIAVNKNDDALIGFAEFSSTIHPSAAYALHLHTDAADSIHAPFIYRHGLNTYYQTFGGAKNRWGDYSGTCVDPSNDADFWTLQESVPSTANNWDVWWAHLTLCPTPATGTPNVIPASICEGARDMYSINPIAGATSYTWTVSGAGWTSTPSTGDSIYLTAGSGIATVTVVGNNSCGAGSSYIFTITPTVIPPAPSITAASVICIGASSATFNASTIGATTYNWSVTGTGWSTAGSTTSSITATVGTGPGTIICYGTNSCGTGPADTLTVTPSGPPGPDTLITGLTTGLCSGMVQTYTTDSVPGATSYNWSVTGTGWSGSSTGTSINVTVGTGVGRIVVTPVNPCGSGTSYTLSGLRVVTSPTASYSILHRVVSVMQDDTISFTGTATATAIYSWSFAGGAAFPGTGRGPHDVYWATPGVKNVSLIVTDSGCSSPAFRDSVIVGAIGIQNVAGNQFGISISPNPNHGSFNASFGEEINVPVDVVIYDVTGKKVFNQSFVGTSNKMLRVETQDLVKGNYIAAFTISDQTTNIKFSVDR